MLIFQICVYYSTDIRILNVTVLKTKIAKLKKKTMKK